MMSILTWSCSPPVGHRRRYHHRRRRRWHRDRGRFQNLGRFPRHGRPQCPVPRWFLVHLDRLDRFDRLLHRFLPTRRTYCHTKGRDSFLFQVKKCVNAWL